MKSEVDIFRKESWARDFQIVEICVAAPL